jgi:hypothetical protein
MTTFDQPSDERIVWRQIPEKPNTRSPVQVAGSAEFTNGVVQCAWLQQLFF